MANGKVQEPQLDSKDSFQANGTRYWVEVPEGLSIERKLAFTKETVRIAFGYNIEGMIANYIEMRKYFDKQALSKVGNLIETGIQRLGEINQRRDPVIWAAALFINTKDEDRTVIPGDAERQRKIDDWNKEGVPYFFLQGCVATFSDTLTALYAAYTRTSPEPTSGTKSTRKPAASRTNSTSSKKDTKNSA